MSTIRAKRLEIGVFYNCPGCQQEWWTNLLQIKGQKWLFACPSCGKAFKVTPFEVKLEYADETPGSETPKEAKVKKEPKRHKEYPAHVLNSLKELGFKPREVKPIMLRHMEAGSFTDDDEGMLVQVLKEVHAS